MARYYCRPHRAVVIVETMADLDVRQLSREDAERFAAHKLPDIETYPGTWIRVDEGVVRMAERIKDS
jgi:hypothetical protein